MGAIAWAIRSVDKPTHINNTICDTNKAPGKFHEWSTGGDKCVCINKWRILRPQALQDHKNNRVSRRSEITINLMTGMGFIGAHSIWPAKISVLYAFFLFFAIFALKRLERRFDIIDVSKD